MAQQGGGAKPTGGQEKGGQEKPTGGQEKEKPKEASSAKAGAMTPLRIPVTGVTAANAAAVESSLKGLTHPAWKCPDCGAMSSAKGTCPACKKELVEEKNAPLVREVKVDATDGAVQIALAPGQMLKLTDLERALKTNSVTLETRKLTIPAYTKLYIAAPADAKDAQAAVQKALTDSKAFSNVAVRTDEATKQLVALVETSKTSANYAEVAGAIEKAGTGFKLADVAWTAPCPMCSKAGNVQANCKGCWPTSS
jgi:hypothetical protein